MTKVKKHHDIGFLLIAVIKVLKGVVLLIAGIGALSLLNRDLSVTVKHWASVLQIDQDGRFVQRLVARLGGVDRKDMEVVAGTTLFYATLLLTEGIGLLYEKVWAEYMTFIITSSFIPWEGYKIVTRALAEHYHDMVPLCTLFVFNILAAAYLAWRLHQRAMVIRKTKHEALVATAMP